MRRLEPESAIQPPQGLLGKSGRAALKSCRGAGRGFLMLLEAVRYIPTVFERRRLQELVDHMYLTGIKSLGVVTVVAMFTGMILALQTGLELRRFSQEANIGTAVTVVMLREMGPFMTGLVIAASVGSAIAAAIGTMVVSDEVAALEIMSINPVRFLVMPRLVALMIMMPILTVYTNILGILGGALVGFTQLDVSFTSYFDNAQQYAANKDLYVGLFKAWLFGIIIATVACYQGFSTTGGAVGVGQATRRTVVISFLTILVFGYFVTRVFYA